jgi:hypothetical protein
MVGGVGCSCRDGWGVGHDGTEEEVEVLDEDFDEEEADLLDAGDI